VSTGKVRAAAMIDLLLTVRRLLPVHSRLLLREQVAVAAASVRWRTTRIWDAVVATVLRAAAVLRRAAVLRPTVFRASSSPGMGGSEYPSPFATAGRKRRPKGAMAKVPRVCLIRRC
jgi:hypothetical protein